MTSFLSWAMGLIAAPPVFQPPEIPTGMAWCARCDDYRTYDVLPGTSSHAIPPWAFCCFCGSLLDVDLPEPEDGAA